MNLTALALDYDGTIARQDVLDPEVRAAIAEVRTAGVSVLLVTGRILDDFRRATGDLRFVDAVVAENGAVLHVPASGHTSTLAPEIPRAFVEEVAPVDSRWLSDMRSSTPVARTHLSCWR